MKVAVVIAAVAALRTTAAADPLDELGFGAAGTGMATARTAIATGAEAAHENPAGVARIDAPEALIGYSYAWNHLSIDGHGAGVDNARGTSLGLAVPIEIGGIRIAGAVATYLPDQFLARIQLTPVSEPSFVRFATAQQRIVVEPVAAIDLGDVAIGAGASILADAQSRDLTFNVGGTAGKKSGTASLDLSLPLRAAPLVGVWWRALPNLELAATFRGELSLDLALTITANVNVPGVVTGDAIVSLKSASYFTPARGTLAAAYRPSPSVVYTGEVGFERWHALGSGAPDLSIAIQLDVAPPIVNTTRPPAHFHDIPTVRLGTERGYGNWKLRGGLAWLPSPVPAQTGLTSFADGDRYVVAAGVGRRVTHRWLTEPLELDVGVMYQHIQHELIVKDFALQPGGAFSAGGDILQGSASATVRF